MSTKPLFRVRPPTPLRLRSLAPEEREPQSEVVAEMKGPPSVCSSFGLSSNLFYQVTIVKCLPWLLRRSHGTEWFQCVDDRLDPGLRSSGPTVQSQPLTKNIRRTGGRTPGEPYYTSPLEIRQSGPDLPCTSPHPSGPTPTLSHEGSVPTVVVCSTRPSRPGPDPLRDEVSRYSTPPL